MSSDWLDAEQHVERAHELYEAGRWDEAESELRTALSFNPYQPEWHFNLGLTLEAAGRHKEASDAFIECFNLQDPDGQAAFSVGVNLTRAGEHERALDWLDKSENLGGPREGTPADVLVYKVEALAALGRHEDAEAAFFLAQQHDADHPDLYAAMADSLMDRKLYDRAVWCLREAARLDPEMPRIQARLAEAYASTGRLERARQLFIRELRRDPGDIDTLLDLGDLLATMNRVAEAGEKYRRILELEPDQPDAHAALGDLASDAGQLDEAVSSYEIVLRLEPSDHDARRRLAGLLLDRDRPAEPRLGREADRDRARALRLEEYRRLRREPDAKLAHDELDELGRLLLDAARPAEARSIFNRLRALRPDDALAVHHLSVSLLEAAATNKAERARLFDQGVEEAKRALRMDPTLVAAMHNLAVAYLRRGKWARARYWVRQAIKAAPEDASLRRLRLALVARSGWMISLAVYREARRATRRAWGLLGRPVRRKRSVITHANA